MSKSKQQLTLKSRLFLNNKQQSVPWIKPMHNSFCFHRNIYDHTSIILNSTKIYLWAWLTFKSLHWTVMKLLWIDYKASPRGGSIKSNRLRAQHWFWQVHDEASNRGEMRDKKHLNTGWKCHGETMQDLYRFKAGYGIERLHAWL